LETRVTQARANLASAQAAVQVAQATMDNTKAAVETARANTESAKANVEKARVTLADARRTLERNTELVRRSLIPQSELDTAQTAHDAAVSQLKLSEAQQDASAGQFKSAQAQARLAEAQHVAALAQVEQVKAALQAAALDLQHTTIRAPVNGIVVSRNVDMGQTVAASLQAPTLFLIAQDLTQMQVDTNVSEADIGRVSVEQTATFTVDAYPNTTFRGKVVQVRNAPITIQNVVTYDAVVQVANPELRLKPGMTANVSFLIAERNDSLKVPNAALRFQADGTGQSTASAQDNRDAGRGGGGGGAGRTQEIQQRLTQALALSSEQQVRLGELAQYQLVKPGVGQKVPFGEVSQVAERTRKDVVVLVNAAVADG
jgi:HlyD family secretion protein